MTTLLRSVSVTGLALATTLASLPSHAQQPAPAWLPAAPGRLPRWRGFNLLEKFQQGRGNQPFVEKDFQLISRLGFNFVRLPMDYRLWIVDGDWRRFDEAVLREIDQAVAWGEAYGIHVSINFHRAPGYTVAKPKEAKDLWTDAEAQEVCALHWRTFARRYRGIPSERLSFNLMNEPSGIDGAVYAGVVKLLVDAIRAEDPNRLVICDGLQWGSRPCLELLPLSVAQATRGYTPFQITHYKASWVQGTDVLPTPTWPKVVVHGVLYHAGAKPEFAGSLQLEGPFGEAHRLRLRVGVISQAGTLLVQADGTEILRREFVCGPGEGEWKKAEFKEQWGIHQNTYDLDCTAVIPAGTQVVTCTNVAGDWMQLTELGLTPQRDGAAEVTFPLDTTWGRQPGSVRYAPGDPLGPFSGGTTEDRQWLWNNTIVPWKEAEAVGVGVMVGEWGAFNKTPHEVVLRWAEDCLRNWQQAGWGWAMWNFRGSFGILDSGRADVAYEEFEGHQLDRKLLDLLLRY